MENNIKRRVLDIARHVIKTHDTVRTCATVFGVSKSTVHNDLSKRLKKINILLHWKVKKILRINFSEKHIRGGITTAKLYKNKKKL